MRTPRLIFLFAFIFLFHGCENQNDHDICESCIPRQVVLTWQQDPATTMTITWRTDDLQEFHTLRYTDRPGGLFPRWRTFKAETSTFPETAAWLHTVELTGLDPDTDYHVVIEHGTQPEVFHFRTIPDQSGQRELVFLAGGDSRTRRDVRREINAMAAMESPDFVLFNGDFINSPLSEEDWDDWFDDWHEQLITAEGRRIPIVPAIGNHEVAGGFLQPRTNAPFYFNRFVVPEPRNYYALTVGPDLLLITLDSDHVTDVTAQNEWLENTLQRYVDKRWKVVQYHVAAWPSVRDFDSETPAKIRQNWIPLFEKYGVNLVNEAHDHAFKKTVPIRQNKQDDQHGIVYIGDGGWGAPLRATKSARNYWWLEEAMAVDHFWKLTLSADGDRLMVEPVIRVPVGSFVLE